VHVDFVTSYTAFPPPSSKATIEVVHGLMEQVVKDRLFNLPTAK